MVTATVEPSAPAPPEPRVASAEGDEPEEAMPSSPMTMQDGIRAVHQAITQAQTQPRWPMYVRQAKQFLRTAIPGFDERKYGFVSVVDLLRAAGKEGVLRIERDRQGAVRVFPGPNLAVKPVTPPQSSIDLDETVDVEVPSESIVVPAEVVGVVDEELSGDADSMVPEAIVIEEGSVEPQPIDVSPEEDEEDAQPQPTARPKRPTRRRKTAGTRATPHEAKPPRPVQRVKTKRRMVPPETD
jgi:hypothetical protein